VWAKGAISSKLIGAGRTYFHMVSTGRVAPDNMLDNAFCRRYIEDVCCCLLEGSEDSRKSEAGHYVETVFNG
jgi:hypothetical protein